MGGKDVNEIGISVPTTEVRVGWRFFGGFLSDLDCLRTVTAWPLPPPRIVQEVLR